MNKKILIIIVGIILLTGCGKKCVKSHKEESKCIRHICTGYKYRTCYTYLVKCQKTICDEYEEDSNE